MNYQDEWNLESIPHELFKSEWARRCSAMRITRKGKNSRVTSEKPQQIRESITVKLYPGKVTK